MFSMPVLTAALHGPSSTGLRSPPFSAKAGHANSTMRLARFLAPALDHVGRGMLLVTETGRVLHANRPALAALDAETPLLVEHGHLRGRAATDALPLADALANAGLRGLRRLLTLGSGPRTLTLAVLPLEAGADPADEFGECDDSAPRAVLVSLPQGRKATQMQDLALSCFARQCGFTAAETAVLQALVEGRMPTDIARAKGVQLSTVRTQIGQLRVKTGARSIRDLLDRVAMLPPMMAVLQS